MLSDIKQLSKETAVYGISTILGRFLNFLLVPFYTNVFTQAEYGIVTNIYAYIALFNIIYLYGMDSAYMKFASTRELGDEKKTFSTAYNPVFISTILFSFIIFFFRNELADQFQLGKNNLEIIFFTIGILFFDSVSLVPFGRLRLQNRAMKFALIKSINIIVNLILNIILILQFKLGIEAVFISGFVASLLTWILLMPEILSNLKIILDKNLLKELLKFGIPFVPAGLASMVTQVIDRPIMLALTNAETVGVYQANYKLGIFMMLFVSMFQYAWQPFFLKNAYRDDAKILFGKILTFFTLAASAIFILLSLFIEDVVKISIFGKYIIGSDFWGGLYIVPIILLAYLFNGMYVNFLAGIQIEKKTNYLPLVTGASAIVNVIANFILIPPYGMLGAAYATLFAYLVMAVMIYFVAQRFYRVQYEFNKLSLIGFTLLISFGGYLIVKEYELINLFALKMLSLLFFVLLIFSLRLVKFRHLRSIFS